MPIVGGLAPLVATARVRIFVVTWNRKAYAENILRSLAKQTYPIGLVDVALIDNASTDGTTEHIAGLFNPEAIIANRTEQAHQPRFEREPLATGNGHRERNILGFRSLTIVRNQANVGGCGGFNTGFGLTEWLSKQDPTSAPDYVWLVDDDADVPPDALEQLARAMQSSPDIGLVGSRTVNIADRKTTIETTIYYNYWTGAMQDDCPPENPKRKSWERWVKRTGGTRGELEFHGVIDVDVVSACSMLARWAAVVGTKEEPGVGYWDWRYFIYCDDADWCLRFAAAGYRVVLNLDAVVFHTPWNLKLTPSRIYYANRNKVWMGQKVLHGSQLRIVTRRAMKSMLKDSLKAAMHRRLFHAGIILDTARDIAIGRTGKTGSDGPPGEPVFDALRRLNLLRADARIAVLGSQPEAPNWIAALRTHVQGQLAPGQSAPQFLPVLRNDVANPPIDAILYGGHWPSRIKKQWHLFSKKPDAVVVFEQTNDLPVLLRGGWNLHIDQKKPTIAQVEKDGWTARLRFIGRWIPIAARCMYYARTIKPYQRTGKYG
jgi:GT2 family glycosyltransferase